MSAASLRSIPAVEKVLQALGDTGLPRPVLAAVVRKELAELRTEGEIPEFDGVMDRIRQAAQRVKRSRLQPVINGTGILVHTNLGRAPLGSAVIQALGDIGSHYNNLEYDLTRGERGDRAAYLEHNLALVCQSEAATVVNNCAAALVLALRHFTRHKPEVLISRGELVQIGGGFRIPDILEASGARLREVGTTNQTSLNDYAQAVCSETGLLLKVHRSNFFMDGFVGSPSTEALAALAQAHGLPFVEDLGSGAMWPTETIPGLEHEPTPAEVLRKGVNLVCFSGDKLFGGPQAGIIAGQADKIAALKREPFFRALRCDKLIFAALQTTVDLYLSGAMDATSVGEMAIPIPGMLRVSRDELRTRAEKIIASIQDLPLQARVGEGQAQIGGGALPRSILASITVDLEPRAMALAELARRLREATPPMIGYIADQRFRLDLRTIFSHQDETVCQLLRRINWDESAQSHA